MSSRTQTTAASNAIGSERKATGASGYVGFRQLEALTRGSRGRAVLSTLKDRPGHLPRPTIGTLVLESDGTLVSYKLEADRSRAEGKFRPTVLMERVSRRLEAEPKPRSQTWIEENVEGKAGGLRKALEVLIDESFVARQESSRGFEHTVIRPYREADDDAESETEATPSLPRPYPVPDLRSTPDSDRPSPSPSIGTGGRTGSTTTSPQTSQLRPEDDDRYLDDLYADLVDRGAA